jgi:hypothetical protein
MSQSLPTITEQLVSPMPALVSVHRERHLSKKIPVKTVFRSLSRKGPLHTSVLK